MFPLFVVFDKHVEMTFDWLDKCCSKNVEMSFWLYYNQVYWKLGECCFLSHCQHRSQITIFLSIIWIHMVVSGGCGLVGDVD